MTAPLRNVLLAGGPPGGHDFPALADAVTTALAGAGIVTEVVDDPALLADRLGPVDHGAGRPDLLTVLALRWTMAHPRYAADREAWAYSPDHATRAAIDGFVRGGGGLLALHTACICFDDWPGWGDLLGAAWSWDRSSHPPLGAIDVVPTGLPHPITAGIDPFTVTDEVYGFLDERPGLEPLAVAAHGGRDHPVLWARRHGAGRVVVDTLGHTTGSLEHPDHRLLLRRSAGWATGRPDQAVRDQACPVGTDQEVRP